MDLEASIPTKKRWMQQALNGTVDIEPIPFQEAVPYSSEKNVDFINEMIQLLYNLQH